MEALPPRRRHSERANHAKRLPQFQIGDPLPGDYNPSKLATNFPVPSITGLPPVSYPIPVPTPTDTTSTVQKYPTTTPTAAVQTTDAAPVQTTQTSAPENASIPASAEKTTDAAASVTPRGHGAFSQGGIAAVVLCCLLVVVAVVVLLIRTRFRNKRSKKRATWGGILPKLEDAIQEKSTVPVTPASHYPFQAPAVLPRPPMSYNNDSPTGLSPTSASSVSGSIFAAVRCTFIPNLPDELSITTGEVVRVLDEYDDGWALCANTRSEQGMVPLECLDKRATSPTQAIGSAEWRNAQRASSLASSAGRY